MWIFQRKMLKTRPRRIGDVSLLVGKFGFLKIKGEKVVKYLFQEIKIF